MQTLVQLPVVLLKIYKKIKYFWSKQYFDAVQEFFFKPSSAFFFNLMYLADPNHLYRYDAANGQKQAGI